MLRSAIAVLAFAVLATGCTTMRETEPAQTAREQLLLSTAADQASHKIKPNLASGSRVYVDASDFGAGGTEYNKDYAVSAIKSILLEQGYSIASSENEADTVVNIRSGALSIDREKHLFGIPSFTLPIPLAGPLKTPELAIWKNEKRTGIAKFGLAFYNARTGDLEDSIGPLYGFSHYDRSAVLFYGWTNSNLLPPAAQDEADHPAEQH